MSGGYVGKTLFFISYLWNIITSRRLCSFFQIGFQHNQSSAGRPAGSLQVVAMQMLPAGFTLLLLCVCVCARTCESALMASCRLHQGRSSSPDGWPRYGRNANREQECTQRISVVHTQTYTCMKNLHQEMLTLSQQSS